MRSILVLIWSRWTDCRHRHASATMSFPNAVKSSCGGSGKRENADTEKVNNEKLLHLLIMIHQMEGVLLIRIYRQNISNSYKAKSKSFVIVNDFCWIEASARIWKNAEFEEDLWWVLSHLLCLRSSFVTCKPSWLDESLEDHKLIEWLRSKFHFPEESGHLLLKIWKDSNK